MLQKLYVNSVTLNLINHDMWEEGQKSKSTTGMEGSAPMDGALNSQDCSCPSAFGVLATCANTRDIQYMKNLYK